jgi:lysyl-tRNA synthetase class 2
MFEFDEEFLGRLAQMRAAGVEPYPQGLSVTHTMAEVRKQYGHLEPGQSLAETDVTVAGRIMWRNRAGKLVFLRVVDRSGMLQLFVSKKEVGDETFALIEGLHIGDYVWARGSVMVTKTGELSVLPRQARLASAMLTTFPDRFHGLADVELRARQRYVDMLVNEDTREVFRKRSRIVRYIRDFFEDRDFLEVETPMLQTIPGGAVARPFVTHHNALDIDLYMRIAPELYLKRLVVGGFERVFEINRNFRNEGVSTRHNPEFTMLEFYLAWANHRDLIALTEELFSGLAQEICGSTKVPFGELEIDFSAPFRQADMDELVAEATGLPRAELRNVEAMRRFWTTMGPAERREASELPTTVGRWWELLFEEFVEQKLVNPTFVTGFPTEISPLSRRNDTDPEIVDRFEIFIAGREIANGFSELNDPVEQAERFQAQVQAREAGDDESMFFDADYIRALTYAMPPTAGQGIGIDRLVMLLTNRTSIREVILFPTLRPERQGGAAADDAGSE